MRKIGIDARLLFQTGVGTYVQNLLHYLGTISDQGLTYRAYVLPEDKEKAQLWFPHINFVSSPYRWHTLNEQIGFGIQLESEKLDLMHFTYFGHPVWYRGPFISTIHDLTPLFYSTGKVSHMNKILYRIKKCAYSFVLMNQIKKSLHIITPTQVVKEQIIAHCSDPNLEKRISSIHEGVNYRLISGRQKKTKRLIEDSYYLYVGNYYPHKNIHTLLVAFQKMRSKKKLVLAGPGDYFQRKLEADFPLLFQSGRVSFYKSPSVVGIGSLYSHCDAVINPSFSEGFGLPLVEAAYFHKPVIASEIPVFRELLGSSMFSFDPYSSESILHTMETFERCISPKIATVTSSMSFREMTEKIYTLYTTYA